MTQRGAMGGPPVQPDGMSPSGARSPSSRPADTSDGMQGVMFERHGPSNKFHEGNGTDGKHYWLTPPELYEALDKLYAFDFDPCPFPLPDDFDGLRVEWGSSNYVNPPFGSIVHEGKKKGMTAWVRKALDEHRKGKRVVMVYPLDRWVLMLLEAGATVTNLGDVRWLATEDGQPGPGMGRHIACFVLEP